MLISFMPVVWTSALSEVINRPADGGVSALHMAALNGHPETVQLLLDLGASVTDITVEDGTTIDLIGNIYVYVIHVATDSKMWEIAKSWNLVIQLFLIEFVAVVIQSICRFSGFTLCCELFVNYDRIYFNSHFGSSCSFFM